MIYKYNKKDLNPWHYGHFINKLNNTLILYGGVGHIFEIFDLNTNQIIPSINILKYKHNLMIKPEIVQDVYYNEFHMLTYDCSHYKLINKDEKLKINKMKKQLKLDAYNIKYPKLMYVKLIQQLYIFGSNMNNKIFSYNNIKNEWNINKLKMPYSETSYCYDIINDFKNLLIVFYFEKQETFILNLINMKWFKSECNIFTNFLDVEYHIEYRYHYAIKIKNNIHIIDFYNGITSKINI